MPAWLADAGAASSYSGGHGIAVNDGSETAGVLTAVGVSLRCSLPRLLCSWSWDAVGGVSAAGRSSRAE